MLRETLDGAAALLARERGLVRALNDIRVADQAPAEQLRTIAVRALAARDVEQAAHGRPVRPPEPCDGNRGGQDTDPSKGRASAQHSAGREDERRGG